jgi:hypothetical protein
VADRADVGDVEVLGHALAVAYAVNPLVRWMLADDLSHERLTGLFTTLVALGVREGLVYRSEACDGASIWFPPVEAQRDALDVTTATSEWTSSRRGAALAVLAAGRPTEPHFYLDAVGVVPQARLAGSRRAC